MRALLGTLAADLHLEKWHGARNDFFFVRLCDLERALAKDLSEQLLSDFSLQLCGRNDGLGADGVVVWEQGEQKALAAGIWNSDGSRAQTCGNALRCFSALLVSENIWTGSEPLQIRALSLGQDRQAPAANQIFATLLKVAKTPSPLKFTASVAMGRVVDMKMGLMESWLSLVNKTEFSTWAQSVRAVSFVQLANPHLVLQLCPGSYSQFTADDFSRFGAYLQSQEICKTLNIPNSNIGFVELPTSSQLEPLNAIVFERGAGLTQCCGSGGCAMKVALEENSDHKLSGNSVSLRMPGGVIEISEQEGQLILDGPAQKIAKSVLISGEK